MTSCPKRFSTVCCQLDNEGMEIKTTQPYLPFHFGAEFELQVKPKPNIEMDIPDGRSVIGKLWEKFAATYPEMIHLWRQFATDSRTPNGGPVYRHSVDLNITTSRFYITTTRTAWYTKKTPKAPLVSALHVLETVMREQRLPSPSRASNLRNITTSISRRSSNKTPIGPRSSRRPHASELPGRVSLTSSSQIWTSSRPPNARKRHLQVCALV
jgi:hypothetical protein